MATDNKKIAELRLLKVIVQPVVVVDDGSNLQEITIDPLVVPANDWPSYPTTLWKEQFKALQDQFEKDLEKAKAERAQK